MTTYVFYNVQRDSFKYIKELGYLEALIRLGYEPGAWTKAVYPYIFIGEY